MMSRVVFIAALILTALLLGGMIFLRRKPVSEPLLTEVTTGEETAMNISSPAFGNNQQIPARYTCDGENINPPLEITNVPQGAQSLALIVDDLDAPGGVFVHWTLWDIDPKTSKIGENGVPDGAVEGLNDFGSVGYGGPCPPSGIHRYRFKLSALDTKLELASGSRKEQLAAAMEGHILARAQLTGLYQRQ